ncbi:hypothetical protein Enr10x_21240 [Gimesia panareensis]|uniref:Uncharacterized protein n=1 Tax=Gimesia panareensis TaxID=2527978 RepID=A0A517Q5A8_9PLAN|nr:hypothetical protein Enr10x_21240 [Gimesia panareensis]
MIISGRDPIPLIEDKRRADKSLYENSNIDGMSPEDFRMMLLRRIALGCSVPPEAFVDLKKDRR